MTSAKRLEVTRFTATVRFVQGYRYLDRCGDALIRLENELDEGWITGQPTPQGGSMQNYRLGLGCNVDAQHMQMQQDEYLSFEHFSDQTCRAFDVFRRTFQIERILAPSMKVVIHVGFNSPEESEAYIRTIGLCRPEPRLLEFMGGVEDARSFVLCTKSDETFSGTATIRRRRVAISGIHQAKRRSYDSRLLQRISLLPARERNALPHLRQLLRSHPPEFSIATQFDLEESLETEFRADVFPLHQFLASAHDWALRFQSELSE